MTGKQKGPSAPPRKKAGASGSAFAAVIAEPRFLAAAFRIAVKKFLFLFGRRGGFPAVAGLCSLDAAPVVPITAAVRLVFHFQSKLFPIFIGRRERAAFLSRYAVFIGGHGDAVFVKGRSSTAFFPDRAVVVRSERRKGRFFSLFFYMAGRPLRNGDPVPAALAVAQQDNFALGVGPGMFRVRVQRHADRLPQQVHRFDVARLGSRRAASS